MTKPMPQLIIALLAFATPMFEASAGNHQGQNKPNVVVFLSDDQGWGDFSLTGNPNLSTPNIDSLARDGAFLTDFYVCPVCSPTRAEFLTGRYHLRSGVTGTGAGRERLNIDETTIAEYFRDAGYATAAFGKWHNGTQAPYHPRSRGFDYFYGFCSGHWGNYFSPMLDENGEIVRGRGYVTDDFTDRAMDFIGRHRSEPFFVYLPYNTPHSPMQVPDEYWARYQDKSIVPPARDVDRQSLTHTRAALAMCENIDSNVGRMLTLLEDLQLTQNTIVIYFTDNGPNGIRYNDGLRGRKGSTDEGGVRTPLLIKWPAKIEAGKKIEQVAGAIDLLPTLCELAGVQMNLRRSPTRKKIDGISLADCITGDSQWVSPTRMLFSHWNGKTSVRSGKFRLDSTNQLFDLSSDRGQRHAITEQHPDVVNKLKTATEKWNNELVSKIPDRDGRPFTVGHWSLPLTRLPARDASFNGQIQRSNRYPNCSYLKNWTTTEGMIHWPVEVMETGEYDVEVYYCLAPDCAGQKLRLKFETAEGAEKAENADLESTINEPHESPLIGASQDRHKRVGSYVKEFDVHRMGSIRLQKGRGQLQLLSPEIAGNESIEFRMLTLRRKR